MIIFGGYEGNSHLSDMHLLDLGIVFLSEPHILSSKSKFDFVRKSWFCLLFWTETMKWTKLVSGGMSAPSPRRGHSASLIGHNIYFFGGYNGSSVFNDLFRFDCSKWPINKTQFFCFFFLLEVETNNHFVHLFRVVTMQWSKIHPSGKSPSPRWLHAESVIGSDIYVFGGAAPESKLQDLWKFDTSKIQSLLNFNFSLNFNLNFHIFIWFLFVFEKIDKSGLKFFVMVKNLENTGVTQCLSSLSIIDLIYLYLVEMMALNISIVSIFLILVSLFDDDHCYKVFLSFWLIRFIFSHLIWNVVSWI